MIVPRKWPNRSLQRPTALMLTKRIGYLGVNADMNSACNFEKFAMDYARSQKDFKEAICAFGEKREPKFTGE